MAEAETPIVGPEEKQLVPTSRIEAGSMLDRWVNQNPEQALARLDTMVQVLEKLRMAAIRQTYPTDWVIHTTTNPDGEITKQVGYLQDSGAERAGKVFGVEIGQPAIARDDIPADSTYMYKLTADAWSKVTGERIENAMGSRWSGDPFFAKQVKEEGDKVDPTDVMKAAYANLHGRAVRSLTGLTAVPLDVLKAAGIDITRCMFVGYAKGAKGGESAGATVGGAELTMPWGNAKGTKVADLTEKDLTYYIGAYERDLGDPAKEKYRKNNERYLAALKAEKERRDKTAEHTAATGGATGDASHTGADGRPTTRGNRIAAVHTRLMDATKKDGRLLAAAMRIMTGELFEKETSTLSDLTDEQLEKLAGVDDTTLAAVIEKAKGGKK